MQSGPNFETYVAEIFHDPRRPKLCRGVGSASKTPLCCRKSHAVTQRDGTSPKFSVEPPTRTGASGRTSSASSGVESSR